MMFVCNSVYGEMVPDTAVVMKISEYTGSGVDIMRLHLSGGGTLQYSVNTEAMFAVPATVTYLRQKCLQISVHRC